jgi:Holliday junction resolvase RusA-like endonuclease
MTRGGRCCDGLSPTTTQAIGDADSESCDTKGHTKIIKKRAALLPSYWHDADDDVVVVTDGEVHGNNLQSNMSSDTKGIKFTIRGNPKPLVRHRSSRGFMYNPSSAAQEMFRDSLLSMLPRRYHPTILDDQSMDDGKAAVPNVLFSQHEFLSMEVTFRLKRPKNHFVGNKPGTGRMKPTAPGKFHNSRTDIDNLTKFVMDSLNGLLYVDDKQIVSLSAIKLLDSEGLCEGATDVKITVVKDENA